MFELAWYGRGFTIDLTKVPDQVLEWFKTWNNEAAEKMERDQKGLHSSDGITGL